VSGRTRPAVEPPPSAWEAWLGSALRSLVAGLGSPVAFVERITGLGREPDRLPQTFRLTLADGRVLKGRRHGTARVARRFATLARLLDGVPLSRILAATGEATLEEWVDGRPLGRPTDGDVVDPEGLARWAGDVLGRLHRTSIDPVADAFSDLDGPDQRLDTLEAALGDLARRDAVSTDMARRLASQAREAQPPDALAYGFVHGDLAPENIVVGPGGPILVDNTTLSVAALDEDLARTWYRWPMRPPHRTAFVEAYARHRAIDRFRRHFDFWMILALAEAACYRFEAAPRSASVPLERLRAMARPRVRRPSAAGPGRVTFRWAGLTMRVLSKDRGALDWLVEFLAPCAEEGQDRVVDVDLCLGPVSPARRPGSPGRPPDGVADAFVLDTRVIRLPYWERGDARVAVDSDRGVRFEIAPGRVAITADSDAALRIAALRTLRELATAAWRRAGGRLVHAAALAVDGRVILIAGPKGSGKTTLLVRALGLAKARFVANDRVVVRSADGGIEAHGIPTVVSHRPGTLPVAMRRAAAERGYAATRTLAEARVSGRSPGPEIPSLSPAQLCRLAGVPRGAGGTVGAVLLPRVDPSSDGPGLRLLTGREAADHVDALRFGPPEGTSEHFAYRGLADSHRPTAGPEVSSPLFAPPPPVRAPAFSPSGDPLAALQADVPWGVVRLNAPWNGRARRELARFLAGI
jgi:aminoglycoside phosphotransferase (APT) family kinase protein